MIISMVYILEQITSPGVHILLCGAMPKLVMM